MTFGKWPEDIHISENQRKRMTSAASAALTPIDVDRENGTATFSGRHGVYQTTLDSCPCGDFRSRHLPCKHIYRLAHEMYRIDLGCVVMHNAGAVVNPDETDRIDKFFRIGAVINEQPEISYPAILAVLRAIKELGRPQSTINSAIEHLESKIPVEPISSNTPIEGVSFSGKIFVLTGDFSLYTRPEAVGWLEDKGAKVSSSLSSKTNYLIVGKNYNNGKFRRAEMMGIPILTEQDFLNILLK